MECHLKNERCKFRCTGYNGSDVWDKLHKAAKSIPCEECRAHGEKLVSGLHDMVNAGLGKRAYDAANFREFVNELNCVYDTCRKEGRCI